MFKFINQDEPIIPEDGNNEIEKPEEPITPEEEEKEEEEEDTEV